MLERQRLIDAKGLVQNGMNQPLLLGVVTMSFWYDQHENRICLCPMIFSPASREAYKKWFSCAKVRKQMGYKGTELTDNDIDRWEKQLKYNMNQRMFSIVSLSNNCLIGMCTVTIDDSNTEGEIEILIGSKSNRNKGYGTEAISQLIKYCRDELHLQSLVMRVLAQNFAAIKCYEKSGFVKSTATNSQQHDPIVIMRKTISKDS